MTVDTIDEDRLGELLGPFIADMGATISAANVLVGDRLGLCRAMGDGGWVTPGQLAARIDTAERYVREWLRGQTGEARTRQIVTDASFTRFRRTAETPFDIVYEVRP